MRFEWSLETFLTLFEKLVFSSQLGSIGPCLLENDGGKGKQNKELHRKERKEAVAVLDYLTFSWFKQLSLEYT